MFIYFYGLSGKIKNDKVLRKEKWDLNNFKFLVLYFLNKLKISKGVFFLKFIYNF